MIHRRTQQRHPSVGWRAGGLNAGRPRSGAHQIISGFVAVRILNLLKPLPAATARAVVRGKIAGAFAAVQDLGSPPSQVLSSFGVRGVGRESVFGRRRRWRPDQQFADGMSGE
jgi:hypothetical protein